MKDILSMRKRLVQYIFLLCINLLPSILFAEAGDTLTSTIDRLNTYQHQNYLEEIYVKPDKNFYVSGEFLRFSIFCFESRTRQPSSLSKIAYLELLDTDQKSVIQTKIFLDNGKGYGEVFIPSNFESGNYLLRCYTRWMKNYRADLYFQSIVQIINPFKKPGLSPKPKADAIDIQFFAEGGEVVNGISSRIAFRATHTFGRNVDFSGSIMDDLGNVVLDFSPVKYGIGSFSITPDPQRSYQAVVMLEDSSIIHPKLPEIINEGLVLRIHNLDPEKIDIEIVSNQTSLPQPLFLVGLTNGILQFSKQINTSNGSARISMGKEKLDPGIMQITLFNSLGKPLKDRLVFIYPRSEVNLELETEKKVFQNREKVEVKVKTLNGNAEPVSMDLSISVLAYNKYFDQFNRDIRTYLLLGSIIEDQIEDPEYYLNGASKTTREAMDNLMLTKSYHGFQWDDLNTGNKSKAYIPEYRTHIITGTLTNVRLRRPAEGIFTYLSIPSMNSKFYDDRSGKDGKLFFEINDFTGINEIILETNYTIDSMYQISIDDPFSRQYSDFKVPIFDIDESMEDFIEKTSTNMQIQNAYLKYRSLSSIISNMDTSAFYHSFTRYYLDDYTRFTVMEEVFREYIAGVYVRHSQDGYQFRILDMDRNETYHDNILVLLDGVPVFDVDEIIDLDPLTIKKIETVRKRFYMGELNFNGIVSLSTYKGDLKGYQLSNKAEVVKYEGIQPLRQYITPIYENNAAESMRLPDYRNVLFWNPHFKTDENGEAVLEFYTSDAESEYEISVEGLTKDGRPAFGNSFIHVINKKE